MLDFFIQRQPKALWVGMDCLLRKLASASARYQIPVRGLVLLKSPLGWLRDNFGYHASVTVPAVPHLTDPRDGYNPAVAGLSLGGLINGRKINI